MNATTQRTDTTRRAEEARYEVKFVGYPGALSRLETWLTSHSLGFREAYPLRQVNNIYFDSPHLDAFRDNIAGISSRVKWRLRWYGDTLEPSSGNLELKVRRNRLGWKDVWPVPSLPPLGRSSWREVQRSMRTQLPPEVRLSFESVCIPTVITRYQRLYYVSRCGTVRVTFDQEHEAFDQRAGSRPNIRRRLATPSPLVVEVKFNFEHYNEGKLAIEGMPLRVSRHSKYVVGLSSAL